MQKRISAPQLAEVFQKLLTGDVLDECDVYQKFMTEAAKLACEYCGGKVNNPAGYFGSPAIPDNWKIAVHHDENVPTDGGIWKAYNPEVNFSVNDEVTV